VAGAWAICGFLQQLKLFKATSGALSTAIFEQTRSAGRVCKNDAHGIHDAPINKR
jgi:hypothetical protein